MKEKLKIEAINLRHRGYSVAEIASSLKISKSTASIWVRNVRLSRSAKNRIANKILLGQKKGLASNEAKRNNERLSLESKVNKEYRLLKFNKSNCKLLCSFIYWCEGEKNCSCLAFTNSDPELLKTFIFLLRKSFIINESKFRVCLHLHSYHNENKQKDFWSKTLDIKKSLFLKSYRKKKGGVNKRKDYPGCASLRYYDVEVLRELKAVYKYFFNKYGGVV